MPGVKGRALFMALAAVTAAGTLDGCGNRPVSADGGSTGAAGTAAPMGSAGTTGAAAGTQGAAGTSGPMGAGGTAGPAGTTGTAGTTGAAGTSGVFGQPLCRDGVSPQVGCTPTDLQYCYRPCGPERQGGQALMCSNGFYYQAVFCAFDPSKDYSCYAIPKTANAACPEGVTPMAGTSCAVNHCVVCNSTGGLQFGRYYDSSGADKVGYCVCQPPNAAGVRTWSCASDVMWPCPASPGCGGA